MNVAASGSHDPATLIFDPTRPNSFQRYNSVCNISGTGLVNIQGPCLKMLCKQAFNSILVHMAR